MTILMPLITVFDNATLGRLAKGATCKDGFRRGEVRRFLDQLTEHGHFIGLSATLVLEFFGHADDRVFRCRRHFLAGLPCIAWVRPYSGEWFVGDFTDTLCRELHALIHQGIRDRSELLDAVRAQTWETGVGSDMFGDANDAVREVFRRGGLQLRDRASYVASMVKSDPTGISAVKIAELKNLPLRQKQSWHTFTNQLIRERSKLIRKHGDKKLHATAEPAAAVFYREVLQLAESVAADRAAEAFCERFAVPAEFVGDNTTVGELSSLVSLSLQIAAIGERLRPPLRVSLADVRRQELPTLEFCETLQETQTQAIRYAGNDMSDSQIAAMALYADAVEVDKRTFDYITRLAHKNSIVNSVVGKFIKSSASFDNLLEQLRGLS